MEKLLLGILLLVSLFLLVVAGYFCFANICEGRVGECIFFLLIAILFVGTSYASYEGLKE